MQNLFDLSGKTALITGSSSGMGKAIAEAMGVHGATVIVSSNDPAGCAATVQDFLQKNIVARALPCDVARRADMDLGDQRGADRYFSQLRRHGPNRWV